jgi:hypothetical protein
MDTHLDLKNPSIVTSEQRASNELIKLIRKLRWIGLDNEATAMERRLLSCPVGPCVLAEPRETD